MPLPSYFLPSFRNYAIVVALLLLIGRDPFSAVSSSPSTGLLARLKKRLPFARKEYTPLLFFTVPKGIIPECDEAEKAVRRVEKELGVQVERLDVLRDPKAEALLSLLTQRPMPPFLYHRESCEVVYVSGKTSPSNNDATEQEEAGSAGARAPQMDIDRIRAWAKGRYLPPQRASGDGPGGVFVTQDDKAMDQDELLDDMYYSPLQKSGREAVKEYTEEQAKKE